MSTRRLCRFCSAVAQRPNRTERRLRRISKDVDFVIHEPQCPLAPGRYGAGGVPTWAAAGRARHAYGTRGRQ